MAGGVFLKYEEEIVGEGARLAGAAGGASGSEKVVKEGCDGNDVEQYVESSEWFLMLKLFEKSWR